MSNLNETHIVMQFLMGLNEVFDHLPSVNKIYSMILKVEKHKMNQVQNTENFEMAALFTKITYSFSPHKLWEQQHDSCQILK